MLGTFKNMERGNWISHNSAKTKVSTHLTRSDVSVTTQCTVNICQNFQISSLFCCKFICTNFTLISFLREETVLTETYISKRVGFTDALFVLICYVLPMPVSLAYKLLEIELSLAAGKFSRLGSSQVKEIGLISFTTECCVQEM